MFLFSRVIVCIKVRQYTVDCQWMFYKPEAALRHERRAHVRSPPGRGARLLGIFSFISSTTQRRGRTTLFWRTQIGIFLIFFKRHFCFFFFRHYVKLYILGLIKSLPITVRLIIVDKRRRVLGELRWRRKRELVSIRSQCGRCTRKRYLLHHLFFAKLHRSSTIRVIECFLNSFIVRIAWQRSLVDSLYSRSTIRWKTHRRSFIDN